MHVDVYIPHQSELGGKLRLRVEVLAEHTEPFADTGWRLLTIEAHTISKLAALLDRPDSEKGFKDAREILRLLETGVDPLEAGRILVAASAGSTDDLPGFIGTAFDLLGPRSGANKKQREQVRRLRREWVTATDLAISTGERARPTLE